MADKQISDLVAATTIQVNDLFVLEQTGAAKKLLGQTLINWMTSYADGHGGIQNITWQTSGTSGNGQLHTATIHYADATTSTFSIRDGYKGDTGAAWYMWIRYASHQPTQDSDMGTTPDKWMGIYSGTASTAPTAYTAYTWYEIKGDIGEPSELVNSVVEYQSGSTGTAIPTGEWSGNVPIVQQGRWLWTRTTLTFNTGSPVVMYTASRQGVDGEGAAGSAVPLADVAGGAVGTSVAFAREDHQHPTPLKHISATLTTLPTTINDSGITESMRVINCVFGTPSAITSPVAWATSDGNIALSGTMSGSTTIDIDLAIF